MTLKASLDFDHSIGKEGSHGWQLDYRSDKPGYVIRNPHNPILLEAGLYRVTYVTRRGTYPKKGFLHNTYGVFRLELWDATTNTLINQRELQMGDYADANHYEKRWLEFSMSGREHHTIEPRVYWFGLANGEVANVEISRFPDVQLKNLDDKAARLGEQLEKESLENGFVVSHKRTGGADELGDATTYTGFYAASLAWKYAVTKSAVTQQELENALWHLHLAIKGTNDNPIITRFVDSDGNPFPNSPSKDVYTSLFFAYSVAYPYVLNDALKKQMRWDLERLSTALLNNNLTVNAGTGEILSLAPYFTTDEVRAGIQKLFRDKKEHKNLLHALKESRRYLPGPELWPGMKETVKAIENKNEDALLNLVLPTTNGILLLVKRVRDILREQYRDDLFPKRFTNQNYPGRKLEQLLTQMLSNFRTETNSGPFQHLSDLKILPGNALILLHILKTTQMNTKLALVDDYYKSNLFSQDALLKSAMDWYGFDEDLFILTAGHSLADRERRGYLSSLSLTNLIRLEKNPAVKKDYQDLLRRWWDNYKNEDNPLAHALVRASLGDNEGDVGIILRDLDQYPENRWGFAEKFWDDNGRAIGEKFGGGVNKDYSREPLPVALRPKDSFLWQRNSRRLSGDHDTLYPPTDFLFVYWFCRAHGIIPETPAMPTVQR